MRGGGVAVRCCSSEPRKEDGVDTNAGAVGVDDLIGFFIVNLPVGAGISFDTLP
jgi:hypothetical protein